MIETIGMWAKSNIGIAARKTAFLSCLFLGFILFAPTGASSPTETAVDHYYAGYPQKAVQLLVPIAEAGDVEAQYLLGNMLYTLENAQPAMDLGDPVRWYRLAAQQDSAPAHFALGAIFFNRWLEYREPGDALLAESHYRRARDLGSEAAVPALEKLQRSLEATSLIYSNESFEHLTRVPEKQWSEPTTRSRPQNLADVVTGFNLSGDTQADARQLQELLGASGLAGQQSAPDISSLRELLSDFESFGSLLSNLMQLYRHIDTASELRAEPGAN